MIRFLLQRPIAVLMAFTALLYRGVGDLFHHTGLLIA